MIGADRPTALQAVPFATALALLVAIVHTLGALLALVAPSLLLGLYQSWLFLSLAPPSPIGVEITLTGYLVGLVTATIGAWAFGALWALLYNAWSGATQGRTGRNP